HDELLLRNFLSSHACAMMFALVNGMPETRSTFTFAHGLCGYWRSGLGVLIRSDEAPVCGFLWLCARPVPQGLNQAIQREMKHEDDSHQPNIPAQLYASTARSRGRYRDHTGGSRHRTRGR